MKTKHTPGPWHVGPNGRDVRSSDGANLVTVPFQDNGSEEANARFIVTACNAHDDLLAALEEVVNRPTRQASYIQARAAIAKAKGEPS